MWIHGSISVSTEPLRCEPSFSSLLLPFCYLIFGAAERRRISTTTTLLTFFNSDHPLDVLHKSEILKNRPLLIHSIINVTEIIPNQTYYFSCRTVLNNSSRWSFFSFGRVFLTFSPELLDANFNGVVTVDMKVLCHQRTVSFVLRSNVSLILKDFQGLAIPWEDWNVSNYVTHDHWFFYPGVWKV